MRILLVDDSQPIIKVVSRLLKMNKHTVDVADNGQKALDKLKNAYDENLYDMELTDLQMPVSKSLISLKLKLI